MLAFRIIFQIQVINLLNLNIKVKDQIIGFKFFNHKFLVTNYENQCCLRNSLKLLINSSQVHFRIRIIYLLITFFLFLVSIDILSIIHFHFIKKLFFINNRIILFANLKIIINFLIKFNY